MGLKQKFDGLTIEYSEAQYPKGFPVPASAKPAGKAGRNNSDGCAEHPGATIRFDRKLFLTCPVCMAAPGPGVPKDAGRTARIGDIPDLNSDGE